MIAKRVGRADIMSASRNGAAARFDPAKSRILTPVAG
jgi:hypothetical protein